MLTLKKSLGQHFLIDEGISQKIIGFLAERNPQNLLEIGPGGGALTKYLIKIPGVRLKCIEIDTEKVAFLKKTYPGLEVIHADILEAKLPFDEKFTVVGNFPYNISTQIIFRMLDWRSSLESVTGMFQKEVAQRIVAAEGSRIYGVTSVLVQAYFKTEYLFEVDEQAFRPPPKVKSAVIRLSPLDEPVKMHDQRALSVLVKTAFNQRRKTLRNAVRSLFSEDVLTEPIFDRRAEALSVQEFGELTFRMKHTMDDREQ